MIVHATAEHAGRRWGGIGTAVDLAARATRQAGHETVVLAPGQHDGVHTTRAGYRLAVVEDRLGVGGFYGAADRLAVGQRISEKMRGVLPALAGSQRVLLVVHNEEFARLLVGAHDAPWCERTVAFSHGLAFQEHPGRADLATQQREFLQAADEVRTASEAQAGPTAAAVPELRVLAAPLPLAYLNDDLPRRPHPPLGKQDARFVAAGRAVPQKGFDRLLEAARMLPETGWRLDVIVGHGQRDIVRELRRSAAAAGDRVRLHPWRSRRALLASFREASALIVPSRVEPLGLIAAEALAVGLPVVANRVGGLPEVLTNLQGTYLIDDVGDGPDLGRLAETLGRLTADPGPDPPPTSLRRHSPERFVQRLITRAPLRHEPTDDPAADAELALGHHAALD